ncbi:MAG: gliding motility-associated C-terminal domain-containing protein [Saprospiraceae bacterium]|nr:gliding motility-associated C-terminal domain-containing protein [Candidatus Opimibacter skivensis]
MVLIGPNNLCSQDYLFFNRTDYSIYEFQLGNAGCSCDFEPLFSYSEPFGIETFTPEGDVLFFREPPDGAPGLYHVDLLTGDTSLYYAFDPAQIPPLSYDYLVSVGNGMFYTMRWSSLGVDEVWKLDTISGSITSIGHTGFNPWSDLTLFNGEVYYYSKESGISGIVQLDISDPSNSTLVVNIPPNFLFGGLTASPYCNTLLGAVRDLTTDERYFALISLIDGAVSKVCSFQFNMSGLVSMLEFAEPADCENTLDLDCNDSSGATGADYNSSVVTCLMRQATVADEDVRMFYDAIISTMTIRVTGFVPDGLNEVIDITGSIPGIDVSGQGTDILTLSNAGGAKSTDFIDALHLVRYINSALNPTAGERTIEVQFTTESGGMSNVAIAYIQVNELPSLVVDIGPDQMICEGDAATFNAGHPGATYQWSNSETTQTISTSADGQYIVTVNNGVVCPDIDTAELVTIPRITVALTGDVEICDNQSATLTLNTNAPFPITVEIQADPGSPFVFDDVVGNYSFTDLPQQNTTYTITSVTPSMEACITVTDAEQAIDVFPSYVDWYDVEICEGDSVWLGFYWETEAGEYENTFNTIHGCDSVVTTTITILPAVMLQVQEDTCDASAVGVYITTINNPNGCDTVVTTTVSLIPADTTLITQSTCVWSQSGTHTDTLTNQAGCDSLIINEVIYNSPADTTRLTEMTCDSSLLGTIYDTLSGMAGCDSIIERIVVFSLVDTTYISGTSCILGEIGVFETEFTDVQGCDSLVISTITQGSADTTRLFTTSCDPASLGIFEELLLTSQGCDSLIITTVTFSAQDSTFISSATCDPGSAGEFVTSYTNQFGCDSIVTETVTLNISHQIDLASSSCNPADTGIFVQQLTNQFGCDSIITEIISLLPSDQTQLSGTTCLSSEAGMFITTHLNQYGCDSIVTLTVSLVAADTTQFNFNTCDPAQSGSIETLFTSQDGCDSLVIQTTSLFPLPVLIVESAIDYNGYDVSCEGSTDGSAIANVTGEPPYTYLWSTTDTDQMITGLSAGDYDVAITDGNGCMTDGTVTLTEPDAFLIGFEVSEPDCFDQQLGSITVLPIGGVAPYTYSIDGTVFHASPVFTGLDEGIYQITSLDANDCSTTEIISIDVPLMVNVELGTNQSISIGDSALLEAIINLPFDSLSSVMWTGIDSIGCANCLTQIVAPIITTAYSVSVTSADGCADRDSMTVFVNTEYKIYIPNIFSPNGDDINDVIMISADESVREITSFSIFDRWGNLVFGAEHFRPNDSSISWDGRMKGEAMNPGVFTFRVVVEFSDGHSEVRYGDITLMR